MLCQHILYFKTILEYEGLNVKISSFAVSCQKIPKKSELAALNFRRDDFNPNLKSTLVCSVRK